MIRFFVFICLTLCLYLPLTAQDTSYTEHKVRWMENIYTIAKKYKLEPEDILDYNHISANNIRRGLILRIPAKSSNGKAIDPKKDHNDQPDEITPGPFNPHDCAEYRPYVGIEHRVSLILPLKTLDPHPDGFFMEFYEGFLLAVEDLKAEGMALRLRTYDVEEYPNMQALIQTGTLENEELIIGPVYAKNMLPLLAFTKDMEAKIISPLDPQTEQVVSTYPHLFQVTPSLLTQQKNLFRYLDPAGTVWLMSEDGGTDQYLVNMNRTLLEQANIPYKEFFHKVQKDRDITGILTDLLIANPKNQIIVASNNEAFVADLLRSLNLVHTMKRCPLILFGNARWRTFENVDLNYYHSMQLHLALSNYLDYQREDVKRFLARYRALYHTEPSAYSFHGYDVGSYFLRALYTKGPAFESCIDMLHASPLQSNFHFGRPSEDSGFINTATKVIRYLPDYRMELLQ